MQADQDSRSTIRLLIVDDHRLVRDGINVMLSSLNKHYSFEITESESGEEAILLTSKQDFDVIIVDYRLPGMTGAQTCESILKHKPNTRILALSNYDEVPYVQSMIRAGAMGYILKNIEPSQLHLAIKTVMENQPYYSNEIAVKLLDVKRDSLRQTHNPNRLTKREIEVLKLIVMEMTNEEIAKKLSLGKRTVDTHRQNLLNKLHAKNTVGLTKAAYELHLL